MQSPRYPSLYQINTRVWLTDLSRALGRPATLGDIPDSELDRLAELGLDWIWLLSVWQTGPEAQKVSRSHPDWRHEFEETLSDLCEEDIAGSGFAVTSYTVHRDLGGNVALAQLRERLRKRGLKLMLDFVPNHMGLGHPWVEDRIEYFIRGTENDLANAPQNYTRVKHRGDELVLAYGRDPYFSGWPDTLQLDYANPDLQEAMIGELMRIAEQCDGVRCDMAMLVLPDVFERTWRRRAPLFWPDAIARVRERFQNFVFMAEVYWDLEWTLQQQGFDYAYDKRLYDRLRNGDVGPLRGHLSAAIDYQDKLTRFLENHDEPRAASIFSNQQREAAAIITYLAPGLRFLHQGQFEGRKKRISPHLVRSPNEPVDPTLQAFYEKLMAVLRMPVMREGNWELLECKPGWDGNETHHSFLVYFWQRKHAESLIVAVNYAPHRSQCHVRLPYAYLTDKDWELQDQLSANHYRWNGNDLTSRGLFLDHAAWQPSVFWLQPLD